MNSKIGLLSRASVFISQLVEHYSASAEVMNWNPVKALKNLFLFDLQLLKLPLHCGDEIFI